MFLGPLSFRVFVAALPSSLLSRVFRVSSPDNVLGQPLRVQVPVKRFDEVMVGARCYRPDKRPADRHGNGRLRITLDKALVKTLLCRDPVGVADVVGFVVGFFVGYGQFRGHEVDVRFEDDDHFPAECGYVVLWPVEAVTDLVNGPPFSEVSRMFEFVYPCY